MARQEALPLADRAGRPEPRLRRVRRLAADRPGRVVLGRPGRDPRRRARDRPDRRARPLQPARRRDRGAGERPLLPLDHLPLPPDPVRRLRAGASSSSRRATRSPAPALELWEKVGLAVSIGCIGGIGINTAHELGHKKESHERWLSKIALAQVFYGHFYIEHNRGHHVRVATPEDPASARLGETFYEFWPRTVVRLAEERVAAGEAAVRPQEAAPLPDRQRRAQRLADVGRAVGRDGRLARHRRAAVPRDPGGRRLLAARGRQLHGALRDAPAEGRRRGARALRAGRPQPQLELQQHRDQRAALPPAAPQRPPRQPHPALPGAARLRGEPGAADRVRRDDRARDRARRSGAG